MGRFDVGLVGRRGKFDSPRDAQGQAGERAGEAGESQSDYETQHPRSNESLSTVPGEVVGGSAVRAYVRTWRRWSGVHVVGGAGRMGGPERCLPSVGCMCCAIGRP